MKIILDRSLLLVVGVVCAILAWLFWSSLGQNAFDVFGTVLLIYLVAENFTLRQYIKKNVPPKL
jgi:hypothetical protein